MDSDANDRRHLRIVKAFERPSTLGEYAGSSNIDAGLHEKLGSDSLWLFAKEMYGIVNPNETIADYLGQTDGVAVPVRYQSLRTLSLVEDIEEYRPVMVSFPPPHESVAIFSVDQDIDLGDEDLLDSGVAVTDYAEVAVRLGQAVTLLDYAEYVPGSTRIPLYRPYLRLVRTDEW